MSVARRTNEAQPGSQTTLGDLLYRDTGNNPVSEAGWLTAVRNIAAGDQAALHWLYEQTHRIVFTLVLRITNSRETAEEVTVDVFYDVWRKASEYDPADGSVVGWICNQARCRAIDRLRFEHRKKRTIPSNETIPFATAVSNPQEVCQLEEEKRLLRTALDALKPEERQAIETAFFSELTYPEVAARFNEPLGTVKTRIRSGLRKMRQALTGKLKGI